MDLLFLYERGYRIINAKIIDPNGIEIEAKVRNRISKSGRFYRNVYKYFCAEGKIVYVHRLVAYQKFGNEIFKEKILVEQNKEMISVAKNYS